MHSASKSKRVIFTAPSLQAHHLILMSNSWRTCPTTGKLSGCYSHITNKRGGSISLNICWPYCLRLGAFLWLPQPQQPVFHIRRPPWMRNQCKVSTSRRRDGKPVENRRSRFSSASSATGYSERPGTRYTLGKMFIAEPRCQRGKGTSASSSCIWLFGMLSALWYWSSPICTSVASPVTCKLNCVRLDNTQLAT